MSDLSGPYLQGRKIDPFPIQGELGIVSLVEQYYQAYNAGRLREACMLFALKMLEQDVTVGLSLSGALSPAGILRSCVVPLIEHGFVDWIVSTGANLYHDMHYSLGYSLHQGSPFMDDTVLKKQGIIRVYDIFFDVEVLLNTDAYLYQLISSSEFQKTMSSSELHYLLGKYLFERENVLKLPNRTILSTAYHAGLPVYTSSPGDSTIGMNVAAANLLGNNCKFDVEHDVNESAAIVYDAKRSGGKSAVVIVGGGSPKNFVLQTEPQIQEIMGLKEKGHDYFLQFTDARPDTGGLSGATPSEAVSWGKIDPDMLQDSVVAYIDSTVAMPILTSYALSKRTDRPLKRLYEKRETLLENLKKEYDCAKKNKNKTQNV
ncbi:MAG: deoxyhypusine synthase [Chlamydiota bacterium]|nr:deoxyhypusine synthase [Chlamydiota bacterium]